MTGRSRRRGIARLLAVLAIAAFVIAFLIVLGNSKLNDGSGGSSTPTSAATGAPTTSTKTTSRFAHRRTYTIKTGDTLGAIAIKTGVSVSTLQDLNPGLDPQGLVAGQKLKLR
ncbi:MAG TPA: LysM domain-containing protein [Thermoleophilaceae bacterium]|jgi:LysM repeat protein